MVFSLKSSVTCKLQELLLFLEFLSSKNIIKCDIFVTSHQFCWNSIILGSRNNRQNFAWLDKIVKSLKNLPKHKVVANLCENALIGAHCQQTVWAKCGTTTFKQKCQVWECQILGGNLKATIILHEMINMSFLFQKLGSWNQITQAKSNFRF